MKSMSGVKLFNIGQRHGLSIPSQKRFWLQALGKAKKQKDNINEKVLDNPESLSHFSLRKDVGCNFNLKLFEHLYIIDVVSEKPCFCHGSALAS